MIKIKKAETQDDIQKIEELAFIIIPQFYADIIPAEHNIFFVQKFQTVQAIQKQLQNGYEYYLLMENDTPVGYLGIQILSEKAEMILSKLYILEAHRGKGYGTSAMNFVLERARKETTKKIVLTVNRNNSKTIRLYQKFGFIISKELNNEFENGFTILDYEMTKTTNKV